jgi:hypothetical protein
MRRWTLGVLALLFFGIATAATIAISELHGEAGQPHLSFQWFWAGDVLFFVVSLIFLTFAIKSTK